MSADPDFRRALWLQGCGLLLVFLLGAIFFVLVHAPLRSRSATVYLKDKEFHLEIADTLFQQVQGLAHRSAIAPDRGMLFLFARPAQHVFWMKDMRFPIDIFWLRGETIVDITRNAEPPSPGVMDAAIERFRPAESVDAVIETRAGVAHELNIHPGQRVRILIH